MNSVYFAYYAIVLLLALLLIAMGAKPWLIAALSGPLGLLAVLPVILFRDSSRRSQDNTGRLSIAGQLTDLAMSYLALVIVTTVILVLVSLRFPIWAALVVGVPLAWVAFMCVAWLIGRMLGLPLSE